MGHLMSSIQEEPQHYERVGVGNLVEYFGRAGAQRQGRTSFPALVLRQHPDDGSLDLLVFFEAEDILWEQRVLPWSEQKPDRCWAPTGDVPRNDDEIDLIAQVSQAIDQLAQLQKQFYGEYEPPEKSMIEYLADFDERLKALEKHFPGPLSAKAKAKK